MSEFIKPHEAEEKVKVLSGRDKLYLEIAGRNLVSQFSVDYPDILPGVIILPDTSARPLYSLLQPIFQTLSDERGVNTPDFFFFKLRSSHISFNYIEQRQRDNNLLIDELISKEKKELARKRMQLIFTLNPQVFGKRMQDYLDAKWYHKNDKLGVKARDILRRVHDERATDLKQYISHQKDGMYDVVVFDDLVTGFGRAIGEIRRSMGQPIPLYAFLAEDHEVTDHIKNEGLVKYGMASPYGKDPDGRVITFDYVRHKDAIGVIKNDDYFDIHSHRHPNSTHDKRLAIRKEMREIGERIAESL